jgi:hypothetical protein
MPLNQSGKKLIFFYFPNIHILTVRVFIIPKQKQISLFLEFKPLLLLIIFPYLKIDDFIIGKSLNPSK